MLVFWAVFGVVGFGLAAAFVAFLWAMHLWIAGEPIDISVLWVGIGGAVVLFLLVGAGHLLTTLTPLGRWLEEDDRAREEWLRIAAQPVELERTKALIEEAERKGDYRAAQLQRARRAWIGADFGYPKGNVPTELDDTNARHGWFALKVVQEYGAFLENAEGLELREEDLPFEPELVRTCLTFFLDRVEGRIIESPMSVPDEFRDALRKGLFFLNVVRPAEQPAGEGLQSIGGVQ